MTTINLHLPRSVEFLFQPMRYKVLYGGRSSGKTESMARALILKSLQKKLRILCCREVQTSIANSSHKTLCDVLTNSGLAGSFEITDRAIRCKETGSEFIFSGLSKNTSVSIKSISNIDICWVDEADTISERSLELLTPSIRAENSEIWFSFNPNLIKDPVYDMFITNGHLLDNAIVKKMNWYDNPYFPANMVKDMEQCKIRDYEKYLHIWEGHCIKHSEALIFTGKYTSYEFEPDEVLWSPLFGSDLGFSSDATTLIKCWVNEDTLYVEHELYEHKLPITLMPAFFEKIPGSHNSIIYMDCSRPETINHMKCNGFPRCMPSPKWNGSIKDGLERLLSFNQIVIHPRCVKTLEEFGKYSYKIDRHTNLVLPEVEDKWNHTIDAIRYAITPIIKRFRLKEIPDRPADTLLDSFGMPIRSIGGSMARFANPNLWIS